MLAIELEVGRIRQASLEHSLLYDKAFCEMLETFLSTRACVPVFCVSLFRIFGSFGLALVVRIVSCQSYLPCSPPLCDNTINSIGSSF